MNLLLFLITLTRNEKFWKIFELSRLSHIIIEVEALSGLIANNSHFFCGVEAATFTKSVSR